MSAPDNRFHPLLTPAETSAVTRLIGAIDELKGHWRKLGEMQAERLATMRNVTVIQSAGSSTRIEGARLSDEQVAGVLQGLAVDAFLERDSAEVKGYAETLQLIFESWRDIPLTENHIKQLHGRVLVHSPADARHRGEYKKNPNPVVAEHPDGRQELLRETASPFDTPRLMTALVAATNAALQDEEIHPLFVTARFILDFLAIHPFQDGNGRLARLLTVLLLMRTGYTHMPYASLERLVEDTKADYYAALRLAQIATDREGAAYGPWLLYFLRLLKAHADVTRNKLDIERSVLDLSEAQRQILELVRSRGRITTTDVVKLLGLPRRTTLYHLDSLIQRGLVAPRGERRGRYYVPGTGEAHQEDILTSWNAAILGAILQRGGAVTMTELRRLLADYQLDPRTAGALHGRRRAHLRRDARTGKSLLTARGRELAEQYLFALRLRPGPLLQG